MPPWSWCPALAGSLCNHCRGAEGQVALCPAYQVFHCQAQQASVLGWKSVCVCVWVTSILPLLSLER